MKNIKFITFFRKPNRVTKKKNIAATNKHSTEAVYNSPADAMSGLSKTVGFILRALLLFIGLFGVISFLCEAAGLTTQVHWQACYISYGFIAFVCFTVCAVMAAASLNNYTRFLVPLGFCTAVMGVSAMLHGNPISFLWHSILRIYNFTLYHLAGFRYSYLGNFMIPDGTDYSNAAYMHADPERFWGVFLLAVLGCTLLSLCMLKKVKLLPLCTVIALIVIPVFTYNISQGNIGIGCIIAFCLGCSVLRIYDYRYAGPQSRKAARRKKRREKAELRRKNTLRKKEEQKALHAQADEILRASLEAEMDKRRSRMARNAVFVAWRQAQKEKKIAAKKEVKSKKQQQKAEIKAAKKAIADERKELAALKKAGNSHQEVSALQKARKARKEAEKKRRQAVHMEKRSQARKKRSHAFSVSAAGGFIGFGAAAVALLALWIPMAAAKNAFPIIPPINNKVQIARSYVTAYLTGNDVDLNDLSAYGIDELTPRSLSFDPLEYKEKRFLRVETTAQNNVYLRSWIGSDFDSETGTWSSAEYDRVLEYRSIFGKDFTPDEITYNFNKYIYPSSVEITEKNVYKNLTKYGFTVQQVHVQRTNGSSRLLFVPAHMNPKIGLRAWGSLADAEYKYSKYYDGVYSSRFYKSGTGYSTVSFITALNRSDVGISRQNAAEYYTMAKDFIEKNAQQNDYSKDRIQEEIAAFDSALNMRGIEYIGTNLADRYFNEMTPDEQAAFHAAVALEEQYRMYVKDTYTKKTDSPIVKEIASEIRTQAVANGAATEHDLIMAVVDYLGEHYTYTQTPDSSAYTGESSVLDAFLSQVKEGYCSHFATAAAAILREYDIPVRFVEGYIASDFSRAASSSGAPYRCDVKDSNAHAWIEVYFNGMGWMQYEVTPGDYAKAMYDPSGATITPVAPDNQEEEPQTSMDNPNEPILPEPDKEEEENENNNEDEPLSEIGHFLLVIGLTACVVLFGFIIYLIIRYMQKKAQLMLEKRYRIINQARNKEAYESADPEQQRRIVRQINDWILDVFRIMGFPPETGELPMDFAKRVSAEYANLSTEDFNEVMTYIQKEEFGHGLSAKEAEICGEYLSDLIASVYAGLGLWQKIRVRYIKRIL